MRIFLLIILAFPFVEIALLSMLASHIGVFGMLLYLLASALLGSWMLRNQQVGALFAAGSLLRQGQGVSIYSLLWPLRYALAGVLLIIPGVLSELFAIVLLLPLKGFPGATQATRQPLADDVIEGEFHRVDTTAEALPEQDGPRPAPRNPAQNDMN